MTNAAKLAVFDLDGTLNRTDLFSVPAIQSVQQQMGYPVSDYKTIISSYGTAFEEFTDILFPNGKEKASKMYQKLIPAEEKKFLHLAKPYDGIPEMLLTLRQTGWLTAVCSNSNMRYISSALNALHIMDKIDYIQELEPGMENKSQSLKHLIDLVKPAKVVMVGDTLFDRDAAVHNNVPFIGCMYGFRPYEMETIKNTVQAPCEIPALAEQLTK